MTNRTDYRRVRAVGIYRQLVIERIRFAIAAAKAARALENRGVKGAIREVLIADLFRPLLPSDMGIASGVLISAFDEGESAQQDIIIFHKRIIPPLLFEQGPAIVPVESALACIEIKSKLNASEVRKAHESAISVRKLFRHTGFQNDAGEWIETNSSGLPSLLLALETDLVTPDSSEWERYINLIGDDYPALNSICVPSRGFWYNNEQGVFFDREVERYFRKDHSPLQRTCGFIAPDAEHTEVLQFLGGVIDTSQRVGPKRGIPPLSSYFRTTEDRPKKVRLNSGESAGLYVGVSDLWETRKFESRDVPYTWEAKSEKALEFSPQRAAEIQGELKKLGFESELI
jgi:hypothetical protein